MNACVIKRRDVNLVRSRFEKALPSYNKHATVQQKMARHLVEQIASNFGNRYNKVFEIGCGTGQVTTNLIEKCIVKDYLLNDLVFSCKPEIQHILNEKITGKTEFICGNAEEIDFPSDVDLICSGATVQWFSCLNCFFSKAHRALSRGGALAYSTFGTTNFKEIKTLTGEGLTYFEMDDISEMVSDRFEVISLLEWEDTLLFNSPLDVLLHMKATGVGGVSNFKWTKKTLADFSAGYESFRLKNGKYPLTYNPQILTFKKR